VRCRGTKYTRRRPTKTGCLCFFIQTLINRKIVCGIASEENDDFITVEGSDNSTTIINMWY
jgi:fructose-1,6-bisphosphatase